MARTTFQPPARTVAPARGPDVTIIARVKYRAVFFDAGETLVHPHPSFPELVVEVLRRAGYKVDPALIRQKLHVVSDRFLRAAREKELWSTSPDRSRKFWADIYRTLLGEMGLPFGDGLADAFYRTFTDVSNYRLFPDALPVLERLRHEGVTLGVVSNFEEWLERLLESLGVIPFFEVRVISGVEGYEKPDPRLFEVALDRVGVEAVESVYIGDHPFFDTEPASAIGMFAVLIDRRGRYPDHPGPRITTLDDLPSLIGLQS
jgi:putative hydrolase of the HAD superfamily